MNSRSKPRSAGIYKRLISSEVFSKTVIASYRFRAWLGIRSGLCRLTRPYGLRTGSIIKTNYLENLSLENSRLSTRNKLINDQGGVTGRRYSFGFRRAGYNACEAIAIHNALLLLGRRSTLSRVIFDVQRSGAMWRLGEWGSDPCRLGGVLKSRYGIRTAHFFNPYQHLKDGVYIISYWNTPNKLAGGLHTVAMSVMDGCARVFNDDFITFSERVYVSDRLPERYRDGFIVGIRCFDKVG